MATIEQARQELAQQKQDLNSQQQKLLEQKRIYENPNLLRKQNLGYLLAPTSEAKTQRYKIIQNIQSGQTQIQEQFKSIGEYETGVLAPAEAEQKAYQEKLQEYEQLQRDIHTAQKYVDADQFPFFESSRVRQFYSDIYSAEKQQAEYYKYLRELKQNPTVPEVPKPTEDIYSKIGLKSTPTSPEQQQIFESLGVSYTPAFSIAPPKPSLPPSPVISLYKPFTDKEIFEGKFYQDVYRESVTTKLFSLATTPISSALNYYSQLRNLIAPPKTETELRKEAFGYFPLEPTGATAIYKQKPSEQLSKGGLYFRERETQEIPAVLSTQFNIEQYRDVLVDNLIASGGNVELANQQLQKYSQQQIEQYKKDSAERNKQLVKNIYGVTIGKELPFKPYEQERFLYDIGVPSSLIRPTIATETYGYGVYSGVKENPEAVAKNLLIGTALVVGSAGLGIIGVPAIALRTGSYIAGGIFAGEVGLQIQAQPDLYSKSLTAGQITSRDIIPLVAGAKIGGTGLRKYTARSQLKAQIETLPEPTKSEFLQEFELAKSLSDIEPPVKPLSLKGVERIPELAEIPTLEFLKKKPVVVGGSVAQRTQLYVPEAKPPADIDVYVKGLFQSYKAELYAKQLSNVLTEAGVERVSISPTAPSKITIAGKKAVEFLPFNEYLRYNLEQILPMYRPVSTALTKTPEGFKVPKLPFQLQRKLIAGTLDIERIIKKGTVDLETAKLIKESLFESQRLQPKIPLPLSYGIYENEIVSTLKLVAEDFKVPPKRKVSGRGLGYIEFPNELKYFYAGGYKKSPALVTYTLTPPIYKPTKTISYKPTTQKQPTVSYQSESFAEPYIPELTTPRISYKPSKPSPFPTTTYFPRVPNIPYRQLEAKPFNLGSEERKRKRKIGRPAFSVFIRERGRFRPTGTLLPRGLAYKKLQSSLLQSLARTGKIVESGSTFQEDIYFKPEPKIFRQYRVRKGKRQSLSPDTFIQRTSANLQNQVEKQLIQFERRKAKSRRR